MVKIWEGIDPREAEAQLRGLQRRLVELDTALQDQQEILRKIPGSFAFKLSCENLLRMQNKLQREMSALTKHRLYEKIEFALSGTRFQNNTAPIEALGRVLWRTQLLFNSIGQAITSGPTQRGKISSDILKFTELRIASTYPSSFGMTVIAPASYDLMGESLSASSLNTMFQLLVGADDAATMMRLSGELGSRTMNHFRHVVSELQKGEAHISLQWDDFSGTQFIWKANPDKISRIMTSLQNITHQKTDEKIIHGRLVGGSLIRNRFELLLDDGQVIAGKIVSGKSDILKDHVLGKTCRARISETEIIDLTTGDHRTYYALIDIE